MLKHAVTPMICIFSDLLNVLKYPIAFAVPFGADFHYVRNAFLCEK